MALVCTPEPDKILDFTGIADWITLGDAIKSIRKGYMAGFVAAKLRKIVEYRRATVTAKIEDPVLSLLRDLDSDKAPKQVTLSDLSGYGEAKTWELQLADDLSAFRAGEIGWEDVDRGILLSGAPGTGKTYFAKALTNECGVPLHVTTYTDWHGPGSGDSVAKGLKTLFDEWRKAAANGPIIVFLDELDSIGARGGNAHNESWFASIINSWLAFLDGSEPRVGIIVIAATNMPERIDEAFLRPGRLEKHVRIPRACLQLTGERIGIGRRTFCVSDTRGISESANV